MTREEMWKEFETQLIIETRTPITESYDVSERMIKSAIEETVAKWKERLEHEPCDDAISRKEVINILNSYHGYMGNDIKHEIWNKFKELPSVTPQPKVGK